MLPQKPTGKGKLSGIPFGVKDIIETRGLATEYGSPIYKGRIGTTDAAIVRVLRQRGAVLVGKTQSAAFAYKTPPPTRNPRDLAHTPGGTQVGPRRPLRRRWRPLPSEPRLGVGAPAGFLCGVTGFKTSYGPLPMDVVLPFAKSLDTLGFFTHTAADMLAFWESIGCSTGRTEDFALAAPDPMPEVKPAMAEAFQNTLLHLRRSGMSIKSVDIASMLARLYDAQRAVMFYEGARFHEQRFKEYGSRLADPADLVHRTAPMESRLWGISRSAKQRWPNSTRARL